MSARTSMRYGRALAAFMAVLLVFFIVANVLLIAEQRTERLEEARRHAQSQLDLVAMFVREALLKRNYETVEQFLNQWADEHVNIVELKATAPNQFLLVRYVRPRSTDNTFSLVYPVRYEDRHLMTLEIVRDFSPIEQSLATTQAQLITGSALFVLVLGLFLWATLRRMALAPLERIEAELSRHRDHLESLVQARTTALRATNEQLQREIAERRQAEEALVQAQKMRAVGHLTGGVAHDFNNLLTVISANLQMLEARLRDQPAHLKLVKAASKGVTRGAELTQKLLAFSRQQPLQPKEIDLNKLLADTTELLQRTLGEDIEIKTTATDGLWYAFGDAGQVQTALLNLAINARDAMAEGGVLTIETANARLDTDYAAHNVEVVPGDYVMVAVSDTGTGMSQEVLAHAFEPFFTTKETGEGSGLGLSMVYGFAKQSRGHVKIYSERGEGTTVKLYLPRTPAGAQPLLQQPAIRKMPMARGEAILVVEDEPEVREVAVTFLRELGYEVFETGDGQAALEILEKNPRVDVLFMDLVLPGEMSGPEVARQAQRSQPELKVLYTSGYTRNTIVHHGRLEEGMHLLGKPYNKEDLAQEIRELLNEHAG